MTSNIEYLTNSESNYNDSTNQRLPQNVTKLRHIIKNYIKHNNVVHNITHLINIQTQQLTRRISTYENYEIIIQYFINYTNTIQINHDNDANIRKQNILTILNAIIDANIHGGKKSHPTFNKNKWNSNQYTQKSHNCYSYALNLINPTNTRLCKKYINKTKKRHCHALKPQPGRYAGYLDEYKSKKNENTRVKRLRHE